MTNDEHAVVGVSGQQEIEPPTFSPPKEMRAHYLERHKSELEMMLVCGREDDWKPIVTIANHVRGTGAMYGFANIGEAAENLIKAIQNGDSQCFEYMKSYAEAVRQSYV